MRGKYVGDVASSSPVAREHAGISRRRKRGDVGYECRDVPLEDDDEDKDDESRTSERNRRLSAALRPSSSVAAKTRARDGDAASPRVRDERSVRETRRVLGRQTLLTVKEPDGYDAASNLTKEHSYAIEGIQRRPSVVFNLVGDAFRNKT